MIDSPAPQYCVYNLTITSTYDVTGLLPISRHRHFPQWLPVYALCFRAGYHVFFRYLDFLQKCLVSIVSYTFNYTLRGFFLH